MSETTTTTTTAKRPSKSNWKFAGYWNVLIGGFILVVQGFLGLFWKLNANITFLGGSNFFNLGGIWGLWLSAILQMVLGLLVLLLVWEWLQDTLRTGVLVKDSMWLGVIFLVIGLLALGLGGILVLVGGIFYLISTKK